MIIDSTIARVLRLIQKRPEPSSPRAVLVRFHEMNPSPWSGGGLASLENNARLVCRRGTTSKSEVFLLLSLLVCEKKGYSRSPRVILMVVRVIVVDGVG